MLMVKKKGKLSLDWSIKDYEGRVSYLESRGLFDRKSRGIIIGDNYELEAITSYLFRSSDIGSGVDMDYNYYRDNSYLNSNRTYQHLRTDIEYHGLREDGTIVNIIKAKSPNANSNKGVFVEGDYLDDNFVNDLFKMSNMDLKTVKTVIREGVPMLDFIEDNNVFEHIVSVYSIMLDSCRNKQDVKALELLAKGMNEVDIANEMGSSKQAINKRFKKIYNNAPLGG